MSKNTPLPTEEIDLSTIQWREPGWIAHPQFGRGSLRPDNVLDYFKLSVFWSRGCNNDVVLQQQIGQPHQYAMGTPEFTNMLKQLRGLEYVLAYHNMPDVFIIRAQERHSPNHATPLHLYFCANGNIYLAPSLHSILTSRTLNALRSVKEALTLTTSLANFDPAGAGYTYEFTKEEGDSEKVKEERREREMLEIALRAAEGSIREKEVVQAPIVKVEEVQGEGNGKKVRIA